MPLELLSLVKALVNGPPQRGQRYAAAVPTTTPPHVWRGVEIAMVVLGALLPFVRGLFRVSGRAVRGRPAARRLHPTRACGRLLKASLERGRRDGCRMIPDDKVLPLLVVYRSLPSGDDRCASGVIYMKGLRREPEDFSPRHPRE